MELRLSKFIRAIEDITDIHNQDYSNPVLFNLHHPKYSLIGPNPPDPNNLVNQVFRMETGVEEPVHVGLPYNGIWINMNPDSYYYRQALKLKSNDAPEASDVAGVITDGGFECSWIRLTRYDHLFDAAQYYGQGRPGPAGRDGEKGLIHVGLHDGSVVYAKGDGVMYMGGYTVSLVDNNTSDPANSQTWLRLSEPGDNAEIDYDRIISAVLAILLPQPSQP